MGLSPLPLCQTGFDELEEMGSIEMGRNLLKILFVQCHYWKDMLITDCSLFDFDGFLENSIIGMLRLQAHTLVELR